jgi:methylglutaconyl-CoA hydratase
MDDTDLTLEYPDASTAILTLNRPQRRNALSLGLLESLCHTLESLAQSRRRVVILRGAGPGFCAGMDLKEAVATDDPACVGPWVARAFQALVTSPLVTIAAAHGFACAGGAGLMACCDFVVAADGLRVWFPEVRRGLVPALAAVALGRRIHGSALRQLLLLAEPIDARAGREIGLVNRVVAPDRLMAEAQSLAATIVQGAPEAVRRTKRLLGELADLDSAPLFARALEAHQEACLDDEGREGIAAFNERRAPRWTNPLPK